MKVSDLEDFVNEAVKNGWPANTLPREDREFPDFYGGEYRRDGWRYLDIWSGATTDAGMMVVFYNDRPIWNCAYRGGILAGRPQLAQSSIEENELFNFLVVALRTPHSGHLQLRGPARIASSDGRWLYTFEIQGDIEGFVATEQIYDQGELCYERMLFGGRVGDGVAYSPSSLRQELRLSP